MKAHKLNLKATLASVAATDVEPLRKFLCSNPSLPLVAVGSGGAESVADFAALLYGARGGVSTAVTPLELNSYSDEALRHSKMLLVSAGGHNNDVLFAAKRGLEVNPCETGSFTLSKSERNKVRPLFLKAAPEHSFDYPTPRTDGFVSVGTPFAYFALLCKAFDPHFDIAKYQSLGELCDTDPSASSTTYRLERNDGTPLSINELKGVTFTVLQSSWARPVASNLEGKLFESGISSATCPDYRNYCHGRFIHTSNHLEDSAVVLFVTPRERDFAARTRKYLPAKTKLVIIETDVDAPEASFDLLLKSTLFFFDLAEALGANPLSPSNPGRIDKRVPMWIPFIAELKRIGPLSLARNLLDF